MFKFIILSALFYICHSALVSSVGGPDVPILSSENIIENDGKFHYSYETGDGTKVHEEGIIKPGSKPDEAIESVEGGYQFSSPEGQQFVVSYTADENGYQPHGDGIPEIPEAIVKALAYIEAHPEHK